MNFKKYKHLLRETAALVEAQPFGLRDLINPTQDAHTKFVGEGALAPRFRSVYAEAKRVITEFGASVVDPKARVYARMLTSLLECFEQRCNQRLWESLMSHAAAIHTCTLNLTKARTALAEELASDAEDLVKQIGKLDTEVLSGPSKVTDDLEKQHNKFVKALEKSFELTVHRWEPCREGITVFLDKENTEKMFEQLRSYDDMLQQVAAEHGYLLIRRGTRADIDFGSFPDPTSRWTFVACEAETDSWQDPDEVKSGDEEREGEAEKLNKLLTKDAKKLPLGK